jgi:hypothetical protein
MNHPAAKRTVDDLWASLGQPRKAFSHGECRNYFRHCGDTDPSLQRT